MPKHDLVVVGAGPGGYIAAIRAAQLGLNTACIEKEPRLGGTCLRVGCIPSKALLEASHHFSAAKNDFASFGVMLPEVKLDLARMLRKKDGVVKALTGGIDHLFRKNKITRYTGTARITGPGSLVVEGDGEPESVAASHIILATGSKLAPLRGVQLDWDRIGGSTEALSYPEVPEHLVVIGAGVIGLELGSVWARLGSKVTVLEYLDRILPGMDLELAVEAQKTLTKQGLEFKLGSKVIAATRSGDQCSVEIEGQPPITCDRVLLSVGRLPNTDGLGHESVGISLDRHGRIPVDAHFRTSAPGIYAIGDVIEGPMLAHKAEHEGVACVEHIVNGYGHVNYDTIPGVVYTDPEIASVGKTEEELKSAGVDYKAGSFPFMGNSRARAIGHTAGRVKILADAQTDRVLGVHIIGPHAGDVIAEAVVAMEFGASSEDIAHCCHAHPTLSEAVKEAALAVDGRALNI